MFAALILIGAVIVLLAVSKRSSEDDTAIAAPPSPERSIERLRARYRWALDAGAIAAADQLEAEIRETTKRLERP